MGKITKAAAAKHEATLSSAVSDFVKSSNEKPLYQLPEYLAQFPAPWPFPRGDLHHWIPMLNRFDDILEKFIKAYQLDQGPQTRPFTRQCLSEGDSFGPAVDSSTLELAGLPEDGDRVLIERILIFSAFLFENCGNRSLYASSERIDKLLNTTSLPLLEAALRLGFRLAQRYASTRTRSSSGYLQSIHPGLLHGHYQIELEKVETLAQPFVRNVGTSQNASSKSGENEKDLSVTASYQLDLLSLVQDSNLDAEMWSEYGQPWLNFKNEASNATEPPPISPSIAPPHQDDAAFGQGVDTSSRTASGRLGLIEVPAKELASNPVTDIVKEYLPKVPKQNRYELLCRIRVAHALAHSQKDRQAIVSIRLLALANIASIYPESTLDQKILQYETKEARRLELPYRLCDLIHPPVEVNPVPIRIQTLAIRALEAFTNHKAKVTEVSNALGVSVNHGVLKYVVRGAVADLAESSPDGKESIDSVEWRHALFALLHALPKMNHRAGEGFVSAGLLDTFVESLKIRTPKAESVFPDILHFLDHFVCHTQPAFAALANANGLDAISELVSYEVETALQTAQDGKGLPEASKTQVTNYAISFAQQSALRESFKFVKDMMALTTAQFDRLIRNMIESPRLLGSLKTIVVNPRVYGSSVWSGAVEMFSGFIHNEPTCYGAIAEAGLTRGFLDLFKTSMESSRNEPQPDASTESASQKNAGTSPATTPQPDRVAIQALLKNILPTSDVLTIIPAAFGAICLNESGMRDFEDSRALDVFCRVLTCRPHVTALANAQDTSLEHLGASFDELARHHPRLKPSIVQGVYQIARCAARGISGETTLENIEENDVSLANGSSLVEAQTQYPSNDTEMKDVGHEDTGLQTTPSPFNYASGESPQLQSNQTDIQLQEVAAGVMCNFFHNPSFCGPFAERGGVEELVKLTSSAVFGPHSTKPTAKSSLTKVFQIFIENKCHLIVPLLIHQATESISDLKSFLEHEKASSFFAESFESLHIPQAHVDVARPLLIVQSTCHILSKGFSGSSHRNSPTPFSMLNFADCYTDLVERLGQLQSRCIWETSLLQDAAANLGLQDRRTESASGNAGPSDGAGGDANTETDTRQPESGGPATISGNQTKQTSEADADSRSVLRQRLNSIRTVMQHTPGEVAAFYATLGKAILPRRVPSDEFQRQSIMDVAAGIAKAQVALLRYPQDAPASKYMEFYQWVSLGSVAQALIDKRPEHADRSGPHLLTLITHSFLEAGGVKSISETAWQIFTNASKSGPEQPKELEKLPLSFQGLSTALKIFVQLTSSRIITEAPQTNALISRSYHDRGSDPLESFSSAQFLVDLREQVIRGILPLWNSDDLEKSPPQIVRSLCTIQQNVLEGSAESPLPRRQRSSSKNTPRKQWRFKYRERLKTLTEKGYPTELAQEALYRCYESASAAQEYCAARQRNQSLPRFPVPSNDAQAFRDPANDATGAGTTTAGPPESADLPTERAPSTENRQSDSAQEDDDERQREYMQAILDATSTGDDPTVPSEAPSNEPVETENAGTAIPSNSNSTIEELDKVRDSIRSTLVDRCLTLLNAFESLSFELADLIVAACAKASDPSSMRHDVSETLMHSLLSYQGSEQTPDSSKQVSACAHLFGIVLQDKDFFEAGREDLRDQFSSFVEFLPTNVDQKPESLSWIASLFLIFEKLLAEDAQPNQISWTPQKFEQNQLDQDVAELPNYLTSKDQKMALFTRVVDLLPRIGKDPSLGMAFVRLLVILTRDRDIASQLSEKRNMQRLFVMVKQLCGLANGQFQATFMLLLRHIVEDEETIRQIMRKDIRAAFERGRPIDSTTYTRQLHRDVIRAPETFVELTNEMVCLSRYDLGQGTQLLYNKEAMKEQNKGLSNGMDDPPNENKDQDPESGSDVKPSTEATASLDKAKSLDVKISYMENPDCATQLLLSELLAYKDVEDKKSNASAKARNNDDTAKHDEPSSDAFQNTGEGDARPIQSERPQSEPSFKSEEHPIHIYRGFILKCLSELVMCYNRSKLTFLNFSRKVEGSSQTPSKPRSGVLNYLLNVLINTGSIKPGAVDEATQKRRTISALATDALTSLCSWTSEKKGESSNDEADTEIEPELALIRKFVVEHAIRAYKEMGNLSESLDARYSRMDALITVFQRLLKCPGVRSRHGGDYDTNKAVAKIMFEKNLISILTSSIPEIDVTVPGAPNVMKKLLAVLKVLTSATITLSMAAEISAVPGDTDNTDLSSATSMSDVAEGREETPDLFRNSTLGMFEPGREETSSSESSNDDDEDDMYGDAYADDMDFEIDDGHDHGNGDLSDEDEDMDGPGPMEGLSGDIDMGLGDDMEDDGEDEDSSQDQSDDDEGSSSEDDDHEDEDGDVEVMEEITGDDENDSLADHDEDEGDWQDEEEEMAYDEGVGHMHGGSDIDDEPHLDSPGYSQSEDPGPTAQPPFGFGGPPGELMREEVEIEVENEHEAPPDEESMEDEAEEDEEDLDDEDMGFGGPDMEDEAGDFPPFVFGWPPTSSRRRPGQMEFDPWGASHLRERLVMPGFRSTRPSGGPSRNTDEGTNPLLSRARRNNTDSTNGQAQRAALRRMQLDLETGHHHHGHPLSGLSRHLPPLDPDNPVMYLSNLISALGQGNGPANMPIPFSHHHHHHPGENIALTIRGPNHEYTVRDPGGLFGPPPHRDQDGHSRVNNPWTVVNFEEASTEKRWQEDAKLLFGPAAVEKSQRVINSILKLLVPPAIEAEKEATKKMEEKRRKEKAAREEQEAKEREEREAKEAREAEEKARAEAEAAREAAENVQSTDEGVEQPSSTEQTANGADAMEGVERTDASTIANQELSSEPRERIYRNIRGRDLDITDLGIDPAYLDALPEEMRDEVVLQQYAQHRSRTATSGEDTAIPSEYLDALPEDIREEVLQQEAEDRRRRERDEARRRAQQSGQPAQPEEIDPASFIASLDPVLRQQVLAETDEATIALLPSELAAEARALGGNQRRRALDSRLFNSVTQGRFGDLHPGQHVHQRSTNNKPQRRPIVQMFDKAGVATLLRLMFTNIDKLAPSLNALLMNGCGNRQTRGEVVNGILSILQEGSTDAESVDRCFSQLTSRAKQASTAKAPNTKKSSQQSLETSEVSPRTVINHCLSCLVFLTQNIPHIPHFFLTEHDIVGNLKAKSRGKGKGKETKTNRYPFMILLNLLQRESVLGASSNVEHVASLLQSVTQPLSGLLKKEKEEANQKNAPQGTANAQAEASSTAQEPAPQPTEQMQTAQDPPTGQETLTGQDTAPGQDTSQNQPQVEGSGQSGPQQEQQSQGQNQDNEASASAGAKDESKKEEAKKQRTLVAPDVPPEALRPLVNILNARECSGKTFRDTLSSINNFSAISGAKSVFGAELIKQARDLSSSIKTSLSALVESLGRAENEFQAQSLALRDFSPNGSEQAKLNRILTALDYIFKTEANASASQDSDEDKHGREILINLYEDESFMMLWVQLSECLKATRRSETEYFFNVATILLPLIEALMVVCKQVPLKDQKAYKNTPKDAGGSTLPLSGMRNVFFTFTTDHRKILNDLVRQNPKLMSGSFSVLVKNSTVLEFDNKRNYFSRRLHHRNDDMRQYPHPSLQLNVRRDQVFFDSYKSLHYKKPEEIKYGRFNIRFHNEEGVDAGGVTREWFQVLARQMFNPDYALFNPVASDRTTFHPNSLSSVNPQHLEFFKFIGRIIGKALYENRVLDCHFSRAVYKRILGQPVSIKDMETVDLEYSKNMEWMLNNDITDIITETFSVPVDNFGVMDTVDLVENGRNIPVTEENKHEYVRLVIEYRLTGSVQEQLDSFLKGFHDIVPSELISIFDEGELELLISGMPDVDVDDWKNNTDYHSYTPSSPQIQWFWRAVRSFDKEGRAKLLQFVTGTGKVPLNGFKELEGMNGFTRFSIHKDFGSKDRLPSSHTCFNQLDLPEYDSYESLRKSLYTAMTTGNEYFGYA
ncbi:MAG: hypothetical protein M1831_001430 [Alyxoria varia]|nr:MAG: hypothetical protein M1831_001430 [Alyxoria varia]